MMHAMWEEGRTVPFAEKQSLGPTAAEKSAWSPDQSGLETR
jgi:hypothetical protein